MPPSLSFHPPVIGPLGLTRRRSVNCCSCNWGGGLQNTCFRTSASSVPVLSHCTCPDYDVSLRHCTATHQHECFCVRHTPSHTASPDSVMTFFVHELPKNVGAISLAVMRGFCTPVHPLLVPSRLGDEGFVTGTLRIPPATNGEDVLSPSLWYINLHLSL